MKYKGIVKEFIGKIDSLDECELYLSISLAFMSIKDWIEASYFLKKASLLADEYKYEFIVNAFMQILIKKDCDEVEKLLEARRYKYRKYEFDDNQFK